MEKMMYITGTIQTAYFNILLVYVLLQIHALGYNVGKNNDS